ncbi:MAG: NAD(P)/FAD-dependent oxidoreductase [Bacteroidales bacterium]|nr:NAD(P)/FAD-dependent oxidoreductase [Bacteroidales bacterium]MCM1146241.1 NAD(P)/FAD-dependent oxidoreductase [Bacteroidales bacterium]MCM1205321.1 NAD(P)/FAD-dependent oxidoreductase [Bacillota bacterium]MCM1509592.1 NAD(P)/FAD-dependent oxidoreductase [Clostridium sp.]
MRTAIIGAGAAGCFCAVNLKRRFPDSEVCVYESGTRPLAKVAITGGGRCNLTNSFDGVRSMESVYPRGARLMKRALKIFSHNATMQWFEDEGVRLVVQEDNCVFPASQDAMEIVMTLTRLIENLGINLVLNHRVTDLQSIMSDYDNVVVTTGGAPKPSALSFLDSLELEKVAPVPALFTFNVNDKALHELMGTVVEHTACKLCGTKLRSSGPLLITHWGLSGPAILRLSSYGARLLAEKDYEADVCINWLGEENAMEAMERLVDYQSANRHKQLSSVYPTVLNQRLWCYLLRRAGLVPERRWTEIGDRQLNRLATVLTSDTHHITGRGTFKDEFVTCGGIALGNINPNTLESHRYPGLYFAGEVLDVDAVTGGFNLQAAWTTGYIVAQSIMAGSNCQA